MRGKMKHGLIGVSADRIYHSSQQHQIRWVLLGSPLSQSNPISKIVASNKWQFTFEVLTWAAVGIASRASL